MLIVSWKFIERSRTKKNVTEMLLYLEYPSSIMFYFLSGYMTLYNLYNHSMAYGIFQPV